MNSSPTEMQKARDLPFVSKVFLSSDFKFVVVDLRKDSSLGLAYKNTLFFPAGEFTADLVEAMVTKMKQKKSDYPV